MSSYMVSIHEITLNINGHHKVAMGAGLTHV